MKFIKMTDVISEKPEMCYYSCNTVWWTHDPKDLKKGPVPLDCFNSPLFQTDNVANFTDVTAIQKHAVYGKYPVTAFMMAHCQNLEPFLEKYNSRFPGKLQDVKDYATFAPIIEKLVDEGLIPKLEPIQ